MILKGRQVFNAIKQCSKYRKHLLIGGVFLLFVAYWFCLPNPLFNDPTSTVLWDRTGNLLCAKISDDGQWRFPQNDKRYRKFYEALIQFEDRNFYRHPGVNPFSLFRAFRQNLKSGSIKSGGSTITMQVIRMARKNKPRTFYEKFIEIILATRLELTYSKNEILSLYASHAPFGGNVVGIEAASWRYYGRGTEKLSWAEIATLAVLPNSPSLIYPGKNHYKLKIKRDRLLLQLKSKQIIDDATYKLAIEEPLPDKPLALPQRAPHLLDRIIKDGYDGKQVVSSLNFELQERVTEIVEKHHKLLASNNIQNAAALVLDAQTGEVLAYVGNTQNKDKQNYGNNVDVITAPRSTGSILKPYLYATMLNDGLLLPNTLIPDVPTEIMGFAPKNFNLTFDGAVPARRAIARSLNIPAVRMLNTYGVARFHNYLKKMGMTTLINPPKFYGLTLVLGGAEGCLWDLAGIYASMCRTLSNYNHSGGRYFNDNFHAPSYFVTDKKTQNHSQSESTLLNASSIWLTFEAMVEVARPDEDAAWQMFSSSSKIAWKTGTSFGNRDGWAIGCTPRFVVAVWVGNASGEGRPSLTGISSAAPLLFDIFKQLKKSTWFEQPYSDMVSIPLCRYSGYRASSICEFVDTVWVQKNGLKTAPCPYHQIVHLNKAGTFRVTSNCEQIDNMQHVSWFVLPPIMEYYFKLHNPFYKTLPPYKPECLEYLESSKSMDIIYPKEMSKIYVPIDLDGKLGKTVFKVAHRSANATIYWHLDDEYLGATIGIHQMSLSPEPGTHVLTLVDQTGETLTRNFVIEQKEKTK